MSAALALSTRGLVKVFTARRGETAPVLALDGVDIDLAPGEILGLVGANGAGKSTLVHLALGTLLQDGGSIEVLGARPGGATRARIGWASGDERAFHLRLTARANLDLAGRLHGLTGACRRRSVARLATVVELQDELDRPVADLSTGMRARLGLARAWLHDPELLLLDEPARGLDLSSRRRLAELVREGQGELASRPATVVVSHDLEEIERVCDRVVVLARGRVAAAGDLASLSELLAGGDPTFTVHRADGRVESGVDAESLALALQALPVESTARPGDDIRSVEREGAGLAAVLAACEAGGLTGDGQATHPPLATESAHASEPPARPTRLQCAARGMAGIFIADLRNEASYPLAVLGGVASALLMVTVFYFLSQSLVVLGLEDTDAAGAGRGARTFEFLLVGIAFAGFQSVVAGSLGGALRNRQLTGTLIPVLATPTPLGAVMAGGLLWPLARTCVLTTVMLAAGVLFGAFGEATPAPGHAAAAMLGTVVASAGFGMLSAAFLLRFQRGDPIAFLLGACSALLAGIYFPPEVLPHWLAACGEILPLRHGLTAMRAALQGDISPAVHAALFALAVLATALPVLGALGLAIAHRNARRRGVLARY